jgi:hypothetical protein
VSFFLDGRIEGDPDCKFPLFHPGYKAWEAQAGTIFRFCSSPTCTLSNLKLSISKKLYCLGPPLRVLLVHNVMKNIIQEY